MDLLSLHDKGLFLDQDLRKTILANNRWEHFPHHKVKSRSLMSHLVPGATLLGDIILWAIIIEKLLKLSLVQSWNKNKNYSWAHIKWKLFWGTLKIHHTSDEFLFNSSFWFLLTFVRLFYQEFWQCSTSLETGVPSILSEDWVWPSLCIRQQSHFIILNKQLAWLSCPY